MAEAVRERAGAIGGPVEDGAATVYGARAGVAVTGSGGPPVDSLTAAATGHAMLSTAALPGLDLRVCGRKAHDPGFCESAAAFNAEVDEDLNPGVDSPLRRTELTCQAVVGK